MFKVTDIKDGYVLKLRNGNFVGVYNGEYMGKDELICSGKKDWFPLECIREDLTYRKPGFLFIQYEPYPTYDIMEVYGRTNSKNACHLTTEDRELLWKREEVTEDKDDKSEKCDCPDCECHKEDKEVPSAKEAAEAIRELVNELTENCDFTKAEAMAMVTAMVNAPMIMKDLFD